MKAYAIALGLLAVIASSLAGVFFNQVRTEKDQVTHLTLSTVSLQKQLSEVQQAKTEAETTASTQARSYERKIAVLTAAGQVVLDGHGEPVYNITSSSMSSSEVESMVRGEYEVQLMQKDTQLSTLSTQLETLKTRTSKPALRPVTLGWGYQAPSLNPSTWAGGRHWADVGYNLMLGPWEFTVNGLVGLPTVGSGISGMLLFQVQP